MPLKDPAKRAAYQKQYREKHKERAKEYREKHKGERKEYYKEYRENNKEKIKGYYENNKEQIKEYRQTEVGKKSWRISGWKRYGVISEDFESLYEYYINSKNCEECNVVLTEDKRNTPTTRCLDHDHDTGLFRNVLCNSCNLKRRY